MINDRKSAFDMISRVLAITRLDIEQHQAINDFSLNIHGENYFRDIFNFVYDQKFVNANSGTLNEPYIDLVDVRNKKVIQITTTRSKEKILHSLKGLMVEKYKNYDLCIFYLLDKAKPNQSTVDEVKSLYPSINLKKQLKDHSDLTKAISELEETRLIQLANTYFTTKIDKYTDEIVLDLVFKKLLKEKQTIQPAYDDDLASIDVIEKIKINTLNDRISGEIKHSLDYTCIIDDIDNGELSTNLRQFVINKLYKNLLKKQLKTKVSKQVLEELSMIQLQEEAVKNNLDFNKLISQLQGKLDSLIIVKDYNSMVISWILVSYFFEICDVGIKQQ